jgi:hypothetical protein
LFEAVPPWRLEERLGLVTANRPQIGRRAILLALVGWMPLAMLAAADGFLLGGDHWKSLFTDFAAYARSLIGAPLLVLAEYVAVPRLGWVARQFLDAGIVAEQDRPRFDEAIDSTRRRLDSNAAELAALVTAYGLVVGLFVTVPDAEFASWHLAHDGWFTRFSLAGWWHVLVSVPLLLLLAFGWLWRAVLWARFLWLVARLPLRLIAGHPDHAGGLQFVEMSLWGLALPGCALGVIAAGRAANQIAYHGASLPDFKYLATGVAIVVLLVFATPTLFFVRKLGEAKRRGIFTYGLLAGNVGQAFEQKWLTRVADVDDTALGVGDFSATTDLYQVVANVYEMKLVPVSLMSLGVLVGAALAPFLLLSLTVIPINDILTGVAKLLF